MADITNVQIGTCSVSFDGTDLGHTQGGVTVSYEPSYEEIDVDLYGPETAVDMSLTGEVWTATVPLAESTLSNLAIAIPNADDAVATKLTVGSQAGARLSAQAAELVLHPIANDASDLSEDVVFWKAVVAESVEIPYMVDEERIVEVTFRALIDESQSDGAYFGLIGDSTT